MYRRKDGSYEAKKTYPEGAIHFYGKTEEEVLEKIASYEQKRSTGEVKSPVFSKYAKLWQEEHFRRISDGSVRSYAPALNSVIDYFGKKPINRITSRDVQDYLDSLDLGYKTVKNRYTVLRQIFDYACLSGVLSSNPCDYAKVPNNLSRTTRSPLTPDQIEAIKNDDDTAFQLAYFILYTGCRLGEVLALQGKDVDFIHNVIHITKAVHYYGNRPTIGSLKTASSKRDIPLLDPLARRIRMMNIQPEEYFFGGKEPLSRMAVQRRWEYWCRDKGYVDVVYKENAPGEAHGKHATINKPTMDRHSIRHTYATMLYEAGVDIKAAQKILGHSNFQTTYDIYTHVSQQHLKEAADKLNKIMS